MPALQEPRIGEPICKKPAGPLKPKEIQDIAYLRASGKISERESLEMYSQLLRRSHDRSLARQVLRALFPSLGF